jgi:shikimate kinase
MVNPDANSVRARAVKANTNVFLVGPMGAGKSTIGRALASLLDKAFQDTDHEIEARTGAPVALIFEIEGEAGFRQRESAVLEELTRGENIMLATGGGAVLSADNRRRLRERGVVVYLRAPLDTLLERTLHDRGRPLLRTRDRRDVLDRLLQQRDPLYREVADIVVETTRRPPAVVAREIAKRLEQLKHEDAAS